MFSDESYRLLFDQNPQPLWVCDADTLAIVDANEAALRCHGFSHDEFIGKTMRDLVSPDDRSALDRFVRQMTQQSSANPIAAVPWRHIRKDGATIQVELSVRCLTFRERHCWLVSAHHVSEVASTPTAAALRREREENRALLDRVPAMIWCKDTENRILRINKPAADSMGMRVEDIEGKSTYDLYPSEAAQYHAADREVIQTGLPKLGIIETLTTGSGEKRWIQTDKFPYRDETGKIIGVTVFAQDITERRKAEDALRGAHDKLETMVKERTRELQSTNEQLRREFEKHNLTTQSLRESEAKADELMDQASDAMFISDDAGRFLQVNSRASEILGYTREELLKLCVKDTYDPEESRVSDERQRRILDGESLNFERRMRRKNGTFFPAEISVRRLRDGRCLGIVRDVTLRRLAEEALRQSEERFRSLFETALDTIFSLSPQGTITSLNAAFEKFTGWSREAWIGREFAPLVHPDDLPEAMSVFQCALQGQTPPLFALRFKTRFGTELVAEIIITPQLADGRVVGILGVARDVTERLHAEQAVRESESKFRTLAETVAAAAFIFQGEKLLYVNSAAEAMTGFSREELLRFQFWDVIDPEHQALVRARGISRQKGENVASRYEVKIRTRTGESRWVDFTAGVINYEGKPAILGTAFDITSRKKVEQALAERAAELARSEDALRNQTRILQSILNGMSEAVVVADGDGKFLIWNPAAEKLVGLGKADLPPEEWSRQYGLFLPDKVTAFPWDQLPLVKAICGVASDEVEMFVRNVKNRDGRFLSINGRPLRNEQGHITGGLVVFRDVTERKRAEEELRQSEARSTAILNAVPDLMFRLSREGKFLDFKANRPEELWVSPDEFVGKTVREVMPPKFADQCTHFIEATLRTGAMQFFEYQLPVANEMQDYEARLVVSGPDEVLSIVRNITERKKLERQILEISDREQRRIGQDLHDGLCQHLIGTAFASKVLEQKLAEKSRKESADAREIADLIEQGISQARNLARGLYPVQLEAGGLVPAIEQLAANVENLFGIPCACRCDPTIRITERGVTTHLYRIAQEAINNGIKHGKAKKLTLALERADKRIVMTVTDNGVGLPADTASTKGMGLNIMRYRAQMIGATVDARRAKPRGTVVTCTLPYSDNHDEKKPRRRARRKN